MRVGHADLRVGPVAGLPRELEGDHPGDISLHSEQLQVEHQASMIGIRCRHSDGSIEFGKWIFIRFASARWMRRSTSRTLSRYSATLTRSLGPSTFAGAETPRRPSRAGWHDASRRPGDRTRPSLAEQRFKHNPWMGFGGQGGRGRRPRQIVLVDTSVPIVALADRGHQIHRHLERRQLRVLSDCPTRDLIDGGAEEVIRCFRSAWPWPRSERPHWKSRVSPGRRSATPGS